VVLARVAERIGVSRPEIARRLREHADRGGVAAVPGATRARRPQDATLLLATRILGARELAVFRARRRARSDDIAALHRLASRLGIAVERVYELEASARRKMARALA
jgi:DNA-directed RNA polymerase sigma subunit (sigma70/sigma32)